MSNGLKLLCLCLMLTMVVGCRGCTTTQQSKKETPEEIEARKKKQRLVADELRTLPFATEVPANFIKPGHWYQARNKLKANFGDESLTATLSVINRERKQIDYVPNSVPIEFNRHVSLVVGQEKAIDLKIYQPEQTGNIGIGDDVTDPNEKASTKIRTIYSQRGIGTPVLEEEFPSRLLDGYQYNLVVLSKDTSRFIFWRALDCISWTSLKRSREEWVTPYRVIDINEDEVSSNFPNRLYAMTSISHLVINDLNTQIISTDQQDALRDWLHFGGTIIINGPEAIGKIESSFLRNLVPLQSTKDSEISESDHRLINKNWTIKQLLGDRVQLASDRKIPKIEGELTPGSTWVPRLEGLVAERFAGRGRIVMTTFPMSDPAFVQWPSYSSLIHNAILRKPRRNPTAGDEADLLYADNFAGTELSPLHSTRLRLSARDFDATLMRSDAEVKPNSVADESALFQSSRKASLCAWNPESKVSSIAVNSLQKSSGITVPQISTVIRLLIGYLIVLVPVNWLIFRLMGRVELAWLAAPFIAVIGAVVVARSVQLDVGFSRSQNNFGFVEAHQGYSRGVLSAHTSLYTSLSTNYSAVFENDEGVVVPVVHSSTKKSRLANAKLDYWYANENGAGLQSFPVLSNTTGMIQSEEVVDLGGELLATFNDDQTNVSITNKLGIQVQDIGIIGVNSSGKLSTAWVGAPAKGTTVECPLETPESRDRFLAQWDAKPTLSKPDLVRADGSIWSERAPEDEVYLGGLISEIAQRYPLKRGEYIAIGWTEDEMAKLKIYPIAKQRKHKSLVMIHLRNEDLPPPMPDTKIFKRAESDESN